jgi:hypothetical protein
MTENSLDFVRNPAPQSTCFFSVAQANAALPLVRRIVQDIVNEHSKVVTLQTLLDDLADNELDDSAAALESRRRDASERLAALTKELGSIGCELKDWEYGLVDFPAVIDGEQVCLCWRLGEDRVGHWHDRHGGFAGRLALTEAKDQPSVKPL